MTSPMSPAVRRFAVRRWVPPAVFAGACLLSACAAWYVSITTSARAHAQMGAENAVFVNDAQKTREQLAARVNAYLEVLRAGAALFATRTEISRGDFQSFVAGLQLADRFVGMEAIGFAQRVPARGARSFQRELALDGVTRLRRWRPGSNTEYYPLVFLEPGGGAASIRQLMDLTDDEFVRTAVERARDTGEPAATNEMDDGRFLVVLPVYQLGVPVTTIPERRAAILGVIVSCVNAQQLIQTVKNGAPAGLSFEIYDGSQTTSASRLTEPIDVAPQPFESVLHLDVADRNWTMMVRPTNAGIVRGSSAAEWTFFGGLGVSLLLFLVTYSQVHAWEAVVKHETELRATAQALRESEAEAREAGRIKDEFLATLSHELRTPLNAILGWVSMLRAGSVQEHRREHALTVIERNAQLQKELIEDLLDVSRIVMGKVRLRLASMPLRPLVESVVDSVRPAADVKGLTLEVRTAPNVLVRADAERVQQIVWNLVSNAIKFTPSGGRIDVQLAVVGDQAELRVRDTGSGIAPEFLPHVFQRFRQSDSSSTRAHRGLGLGLAIVQELVNLHGGSISAHSDGIGKGAEFTVRFPIAASGEVAPISVVVRNTPASTRLEGVSVLVVDDDHASLELIGEALTSFGARVTTAGSAAEAMQSLRARIPDVLVSDLAMPDEDGYSLMRRIRAFSGPLSGIPAIALTAYARADDRQQALDAGFQIHLAKPVDLADLESAIARVSRPSSAA
jgi:signal transduction histidine kinase/CheY-like chemotaxis protein